MFSYRLFLDPVSANESRQICESINQAIADNQQNFAIVQVVDLRFTNLHGRR